MSSKYKASDDHIPYFVTSTIVAWMDVFTRDVYKDIVCDSISFCQQNKGLRLHAWVIMTNHIHMIVSVADNKKLGAIMRDMKKHTSIAIVDAIEKNVQESRKKWMLNMFAFAGENNNHNEYNQVWQQEYHPVALDTEEKLIQRLNYLHENPVRSGLVWSPEQYKYSSAIDYYTKEKGLLSIERLFV